jgi:hypothetical protein
MTADPAQEFQKVFDSLKKLGLLVVSDTTFPSVTRLITGERMKGSWWSHPLAHTIFNVNEMLEDHKDVLIVKLVSGKVTFVHRTLWPNLYAIGTARDEWQMKGLSAPAKALLQKLEKESELDTKKLRSTQGVKPGDTARELESRLLVHSAQVHTESGAHAKKIATWQHWAMRVGLKETSIDSQTARRVFQERVAELNNQFMANGRLPWLNS